MATTYDLFDAAERIERVCAEAYAELAARHASDPEARALFERLRDEELQHASRVRLFASSYRHDPRLVDRVALDAGELGRALADAEATLAEIRAGWWEGGLAAAKARLAEMEDRLARAHAERMARDAHPAVRAFLERLAAQDEGHRELLRR